MPLSTQIPITIVILKVKLPLTTKNYQRRSEHALLKNHSRSSFFMDFSYSLY